MKHNYSIETKNLMITPMTQEDSERFRKIRNRDGNREWFVYQDIITEEAQQKWYQNYLHRENDYMFAIYTNEIENSFIGAMAIYDVDEKNSKAEIGRLIIDSEVSAGNGYGFETIQGVINISFQLLKLDMIYANIYEDNIPCIKSVLKAGMEIKGTLTDENGKTLVHVEKYRCN